MEGVIKTKEKNERRQIPPSQRPLERLASTARRVAPPSVHRQHHHHTTGRDLRAVIGVDANLDRMAIGSHGSSHPKKMPSPSPA